MEKNNGVFNRPARASSLGRIPCRSNMELLNSFKTYKYPNSIGPGVYDIHSPRVPSFKEMKILLNKAQKYIDKKKIWVNPDCGLKTRGWSEVKKALKSMTSVAKSLR